MPEITECPNCSKELVTIRFYCDNCEMSYCSDCANSHKHIKKTTVWIVTYKNTQGTIIGPEWAVPSKIKPTRWANQAFAGSGLIHEIANTGMTEDEYENHEYDLKQATA
jgi:hypothetical protein